MTDVTFEAGHVFFRPSEKAEQAFLVLEGEVEVFPGSTGSPLSVARLGPGGVFGEMSLVQERLRSGTARALTAGRVTAMTRDEFEGLLTTDPARCREYLRSLFEHIRTLTARLAGESTVFPDALQRPADFQNVAPAEPVPRLSAILYPLTRRAAATLPKDGLPLTRLPLRIGRVSTRNESGGLDFNDLWLIDTPPYMVSRNHCELVSTSRGLIVRDRGSHLGCLVNDQQIGGGSRVMHAPLPVGESVLILGTASSGYQFRVSVSLA